MIEVLASTPSTNAEIGDRLARGEAFAEGHWLRAERQTAGRGRLGRAWLDGYGNFMGSTVVRIGSGDPPAPSLALVAGIAVAETVNPLLPTPVRARLKWPNDVMVDKAKLSGILLERIGDAVVIGIGVNLALAPEVPDRAVTALADYGPPPQPDHFASLLARNFAAELMRWRSLGIAPTVRRWCTLAYPVGTALVVGEPDGPSIEGTFAGLNDDGALQLRLSDGTTQVIHAGEVRLSDNH